MKKVVNKIIYPASSIIIANIAFILIGKLGYDDWKKVYEIIPKWILILLFFILIVWLLFSFYRKRITNLNKKENFSSIVVGRAIYGCRDIGVLIYSGVKWKIRHPNDGPYNRLVGGIKIERIDVMPIPYCPKCTEMELIEKRNIFGRYVWRCLTCGLKRSNWKSYRMLSKNEVLKIAKSKVAIDLENQ